MNGPYLTDMPFRPCSITQQRPDHAECGSATSSQKNKKRKKPKQWVQDWMGKHEVVLSDAAYKALIRKLKAKDQ